MRNGMKLRRHAPKLAFIAATAPMPCMITSAGANQSAMRSGIINSSMTSGPMRGRQCASAASTTRMRRATIHMSGALAKSFQPAPIQSTPRPAETPLPGRTSFRFSSARPVPPATASLVLIAPPCGPGLGARLLLQRHLNKRGGKHAHQLRGVHAEQVAAPPAVDVDAREIEHRALEEDRHPLARAEGGSPADEVARMALRGLRLARRDALHAGGARQRLARDLAVAVHEHHERLAFLVFHDERLDDLMLGHSPRLGGVRRAAMLDVFEVMLGEGDALLA